MIKETEISVNITRRNITWYRNLGYGVLIDKPLMVKIEDINPNSHQKIIAVCEKCGKETKISVYKYNVNRERCGYYGCKGCSREKAKQTSIERFGVDNAMKDETIKSKVEKNNLEKYGVKTTLLEEKTKEKIKKTNLEKYGVEEVLSSKEIRGKGKETFMKKYGVESFSKTVLFKNVTYKRWEKDALDKLERYGITDFVLKEDRTIDIKCEMGCDHYYNISSKNLYQRKEIQNNILCTVCNPLELHISGKELQLLNFIKENYDGVILENDKNLLSGKELDIYLPELGLAFEFNGLYWHSDIYKEKDYHKEKSEQCQEKGVQLFHVWENEWIYKQDIIKSIILNKLCKTKNKIWARKCEIKEIENNNLIKEFLNQNHIQGFVGSTIKLGLFYEGKLVSFMSFGKKRKILSNSSKENEYEMLRFCNKLNTNVVGSASRLFKYFLKRYEPKEVITYADRSYSNVGLYYKLGFELKCKTNPEYSYFDGKLNKFNRFNYRKDKLVSKGYDKNLTEFQIMDSLGYYRVYNAGNLTFIFNI